MLVRYKLFLCFSGGYITTVSGFDVSGKNYTQKRLELRKRGKEYAQYCLQIEEVDFEIPGPGFCPVSFIFKEKLQTVKMLTTDNNPVRASADFHTPLCSCFYGEYRSYEDWSVRDGRGQLCYWLKRKQVISTQQILKPQEFTF